MYQFKNAAVFTTTSAKKGGKRFTEYFIIPLHSSVFLVRLFVFCFARFARLIDPEKSHRRRGFYITFDFQSPNHLRGFSFYLFFP